MIGTILKIANFLFINCRIPIFGRGKLFFSVGRSSRLVGCDAHSVYGKNNKIVILDNCKLKECRFVIKGDGNVISIGSKCKMLRTTFWISGSGNRIEIGDETTVGDNCEFATLEGTVITIGRDCMFSHDIQLRTSDSHSILNIEGRRFNGARDIQVIMYGSAYRC